MNFIPTALKEVVIIEPRVFVDPRGFFMETYRKSRFVEGGIEVDFVQCNHSRSSRGVLRGLHYQVEKPQGKLVRVIRGAVYDVAVDIRHGSPTFGHWVGVELSEMNKRQLYVPVGFAHGFCVLSDEAEFLYSVTDYWHPAGERGLMWNDPDVNIAWPINDPVLSDKDQRNPRFKDMGRDFRF